MSAHNLTITRIAGGNGWDPAAYKVITESGVEYTVRKEFYADGPSLFTWVITGDDVWAERNTKKAALAYIASLNTEGSTDS